MGGQEATKYAARQQRAGMAAQAGAARFSAQKSYELGLYRAKSDRFFGSFDRGIGLENRPPQQTGGGYQSMAGMLGYGGGTGSNAYQGVGAQLSPYGQPFGGAGGANPAYTQPSYQTPAQTPYNFQPTYY
jgi:hypothetical protein